MNGTSFKRPSVLKDHSFFFCRKGDFSIQVCLLCIADSDIS